MKVRGVEPLQPPSLLATLTSTSKEFVALGNAWKVSNKQGALGAFILEHRAAAYDPNTSFKHFQDMLVVSGEGSRELLLELFRYCDRMDFLAALKKWETPIMPLSGHDLIASGMKNGRWLGVVINHLKGDWMDSGYTLTKEELIGRSLELRALWKESWNRLAKVDLMKEIAKLRGVKAREVRQTREEEGGMPGHEDNEIKKRKLT